MSLEGIVKYLNSKNPINSKFYTLSGILGETKNFYDITSENLAEVMRESKENVGLNADIRIEQDFFVQVIETRYILSTVDVCD